MGAASGQFFSADQGAALSTWFATASIDPGLTSVVAVHPFEVSEITEGGSPCSDADGEHLHQGIPQAVELRQAQSASGCERCQAGCEQTFIGVDIPSTRDEGLVQQGCFDRPLTPSQLRLQILT